MKEKQFYSTLLLQRNTFWSLLLSLFLCMQWVVVAQTPVNIPTGRPATEVFDNKGGFVITHGMLDRRLNQVTFLGLHNADITNADNPDVEFQKCVAVNHEISYWDMIHKTGARFFDIDAALLHPDGAIAKHGCGGGQKDMGEVMRLLKVAMDNAPNTVYIMTLTDMGGTICNNIFNTDEAKNATRAAVLEDMKLQGLWDRVYNKDAFQSSYSNGATVFNVSYSYQTTQKNWLAANGFPTLRQMISSGRNIFLMDGKDPAYNIGGPTGAAFEPASSAVNTYMNIFELGKTKLSAAAANRLLAGDYGMQANSLIVDDDCTASDKEEDWFVNSGERVYQHLVEAQKHFESQLEITKASYPQTELNRQIMILPIDMPDYWYDFNTIEGVNKFNMERLGNDYYNMSGITKKMYPLGKGKRYKVTAFNGTNIPSNATASGKFGSASNYESRAYDGDLYSTTFYNSNSTAVFDLGTQQVAAGVYINEVDIAWFLYDEDILNKEGDFRTFTLEESNDKTTWTTVGKTYDTSQDSRIYKGQRTWWHYNLSAPITKRYIRLSNFGATSICELSFLDNRANGPVLVCNAPTNLNSSVAGSQVTLNWASPEGGVQSYRVEYKLRTAGNWTVVGTAVTGTLVTVTGLITNQRYDWRIKTNCDAETSVKEESSYVTAQFVTGAPCEYPIGLAVSNISTNSATIRWNASTNGQTYTVIYKRANTADNYTTISAGTSTSITLTSLAFGTEYEWLVNTSCIDGTTSPYTPAFFTTSTPPPICLGAPAPSNLFVSTITSSGARVMWSAVPNISSYTVLYRPVGSTTWVDSKTTTATFLDLTGLSAGTTYEWNVSGSCTNAGTSSSISNFTTLGVCPPPSFISASTTSSSADLTWAALSGATSYSLEYRLSGSPNWTVFSNTLTLPSATITGLLSAATYDMRVRTKCGNTTWGAYSNQQQFATLQPCGIPAGLASSNIATSSATITWSAASSEIVNYYVVDYKPTFSTVWIPLETNNSNSRNITGLRPETVYEWRVTKSCGGVFGSRSDYAYGQFATLAVTVACSAPGGLSTSGISSSGATVSWTAVSGATNYTIEYKTTATTTWTTASANTTATSVNITGLSASTMYDWRVRTNCSGSSSTNTAAQFTTSAVQCPSVNAYEPNDYLDQAIPVASSITLSAGLGRNQDFDFYRITLASIGNIDIGLTNVPANKNYDLELWKPSPNGIGNPTLVAFSRNSSLGSNEVISITNQSSGFYYIRVYGADVFNDFSSLECYTLTINGGTPCTAPAGLASSSISSTGATVSWSAVSGAANYTVEYKTTAATIWTTASANTTATSVNITGLTASTTYDWRVRTNCSGGSSGNTAAQFTTTGGATPCAAAPNGLTFVITGNGSTATLSWSAVSGISTYQFESRVLPSTTWVVGGSAIPGTSQIMSNLSSLSTIEWRVKGNCAGGNGAYGIAQFTVPLISCIPPAISSLIATNITANSATLGWAPATATGALNYTIDYRQAGSSSWQTATTTATGQSYVLSGLNANVTYEWRIKSNCSTGSGVYSGASPFTTSTGGGTSICAGNYEPNDNYSLVGGVPTNTVLQGAISSATDVDIYTVVVNSTTNFNITLSNLVLDYDLFLHRLDGNVVSLPLATSEAGGAAPENITASNLAAGTYFVRVVGYQGANNSTACYNLNIGTGTTARTQASSVKTNSVVVDKQKEKTVNTKVTLHPNPVADILNIEATNSISEVKILEVNGRIISTKNGGQANKVAISTEKLASGTYLIQVFTADGKISIQKVIKQ